jgi:hypothetical protein
MLTSLPPSELLTASTVPFEQKAAWFKGQVARTRVPYADGRVQVSFERTLSFLSF